MSYTKRQFLKTAAISAAAMGVLLAAGIVGSRAVRAAEPVKLGVLHSLTGSIAIAEIGVTEAERLAIDEINAAGGVLGRQLQAVVEDGASDWPTFAEKAQVPEGRLIFPYLTEEENILTGMDKVSRPSVPTMFSNPFPSSGR